MKFVERISVSFGKFQFPQTNFEFVSEAGFLLEMYTLRKLGLGGGGGVMRG